MVINLKLIAWSSATMNDWLMNSSSSSFCWKLAPFQKRCWFYHKMKCEPYVILFNFSTDVFTNSQIQMFYWSILVINWSQSKVWSFPSPSLISFLKSFFNDFPVPHVKVCVMAIKLTVICQMSAVVFDCFYTNGKQFMIDDFSKRDFPTTDKNHKETKKDEWKESQKEIKKI